MDDDEAEAKDGERKLEKESLSSPLQRHRPNYNPHKYVDMPAVCSTETRLLPAESLISVTKSQLNHWAGSSQSPYSSKLLDLYSGNHEDNSLKRPKYLTGTFGALSAPRKGLSIYSAAVTQDRRSEDLVLSSPCIPGGATTNGWSNSLHSGLADEAMLSPESERSQASEATSLSLMSNSVEGSNSASSYGSAMLTLLLRQPSKTALAQQYFPVTFGATTHRPVNSRDPLLHVQPALTLSKKPSHSRLAGHHHHRRPGSGHSSSSSNSKCSIDKIYLNATSDAQGNGASTILSSTPYQTQLARLQREQLEIEEQRLRHLKIQEEVERARGPVPNWYEIRTPQFHYEFRKHNEHLKDDHQKTARHKQNP